MSEQVPEPAKQTHCARCKQVLPEWLQLALRQGVIYCGDCAKKDLKGE